jgi:hypothetical protein
MFPPRMARHDSQIIILVIILVLLEFFYSSVYPPLRNHGPKLSAIHYGYKALLIDRIAELSGDQTIHSTLNFRRYFPIIPKGEHCKEPQTRR